MLSRRVLRFHLLPLPLSEGHHTSNQTLVWEPGGISCARLQLLRVPSFTAHFIFSFSLLLFFYFFAVCRFLPPSTCNSASRLNSTNWVRLLPQRRLIGGSGQKNKRKKQLAQRNLGDSSMRVKDVVTPSDVLSKSSVDIWDWIVLAGFLEMNSFRLLAAIITIIRAVFLLCIRIILTSGPVTHARGHFLAGEIAGLCRLWNPRLLRTIPPARPRHSPDPAGVNLNILFIRVWQKMPQSFNHRCLSSTANCGLHVRHWHTAAAG